MTISGVKIKKADGTWGGGAAPAPDVQDFTSSGTWTKPDGARFVWVELLGAGGGGANSRGGGGGEYVAMLLDAASLAATEPVGIGAGGVSKSSPPTANGGNTTFSALIAYGGMGVADLNLYQNTPVSNQQIAPVAFGNAGYSPGGWGTSLFALLPMPAGSYTGPVTTCGGGSGGLVGVFSPGVAKLGGGAGGGGLGGTIAAALGALQAGNGAPSSGSTAAGIAGGGIYNSVAINGGSGAARITTYF